MNLDAYIESILFFKGDPISVNRLSKILGKNKEEVNGALKTLEEKLQDRGLRLVFNEGKVMLGTASKASGFIEGLIKGELSKDIGQAGLETLSIVLYRGPITRSGIDYIRGVNSSFILRNLLIRGLIEKTPNPKDQRSSLYRPTLKLLSFLGVSKLEQMPKYSQIKAQIKEFEKEK
jgi:segregation and condensation protein B